eukprot:CAMPEP_0202445890 /NCGR_PEP_ID=MMETSP1360-20130828/4607_1 /ASSEMBLY_ACC=CAM_ASM_000848 /TAXON_ID=515479 /ORGANISM="Licmophora paradoxa, Strain CCMP2313" /LENGTH=556 /DNA_ID=CAMNT_0049062295 /DNA_START=45 /DNA_END=1715 /DNA_ORIENTATION=-
MNRQLGGAKSGGETSEASPLSLLVHAADTQRGQSGKSGDGKGDGNGGEPGSRLPPDAAPSNALDAQALALQQQHQGILAQLRGVGGGGGMADAELLQQNAALVAAQQQQQAAALALASDIRTAVAAAQLRQAAQFQNQDLLLARAAAVQQQLGALGGAPGVDQLQHELELRGLEELERRQLLAAAAGAPLGSIAARQQLEFQEAHMRQEQLDRQLGANGGESSGLLERAGLRQGPVAAPEPTSSAATRTQSETPSKESFQKTPGSVVVPCRARGMPMDHNFKTAYFVIPENVEHGEELICSYFACRNAGIKFRYCTHCKVPVAKRNFRKRHKHGKPNIGPEDDEEEDDDSVSKAKVQSAPVSEKKTKPSAKKNEIPSATVSAVTAAVQRAEKPSKKVKETRPDNDEGENSVLAQMSSQDRPKISVERERLWACLLGKRPPTKDGEAVSAWLMEVLSVSDLETPLKENGTPGTPAAVPPFPIKSGIATASDDNKLKEEGGSPQLISTKKKRPLALLQKDEDDKKDDSQKKGEIGSFSDWKDRKKHKGLPKKFLMGND